MSRIGKNPVSVPKDIKVSINASNVHMEGPKGKMDLLLPTGISVTLKEDKLQVNRQMDTKQDRANHGTVRAKLANMIEGLTKGHKKELEIQGLGFRSQLQGSKIILNLGLSHPVEFNVPKEVKVTVTPQNNIIIEGADIEKVGSVAASLRDIKPVEPYKGKGIRYVGEVVRRKQGKSVTK
jgi:large subunit ribosomal protein L6